MSMTVGQLRALLEQLPDDYTVSTEGCDCDGEVCSIKVFSGERDVYLQRTSKDSGNPDTFAAGDWVGYPTAIGLVPYE